VYFEKINFKYTNNYLTVHVTIYILERNNLYKSSVITVVANNTKEVGECGCSLRRQ